MTGGQANQFTLTRNGSPLLGATYGTAVATGPNSGQVIVTLSAGDSVQLQNTASSSVTLDQFGGVPENVNASIVLEKIG